MQAQVFWESRIYRILGRLILSSQINPIALFTIRELNLVLQMTSQILS